MRVRWQPPGAVGAEATAGHHVMDVRVIIQRAAPCVEYAEEPASRGTHVLGIGGQGLDRLARGLEERSVGDTLMTAARGAQRGRDREGQQEISTRQQAAGLRLEPRLGLVLLAGRAMSIA